MNSARQYRRLSLYAIFILAQVLFLFSSVFKIDSIRAQGNVMLSEETIVKQSALQKGDYLWAYLFVSPTDSLKTLPQIDKCALRLFPGGKVVLFIKERAPQAKIFCQKDSMWFLVDKTGLILSSNTELPQFKKIPKLIIERPVPRFGHISATFVDIMQTVNKSIDPLLKDPIDHFELDNTQSVNVVTTFLKHPVTIRVGTLKNLNIKMDVLRSILAQLRAQNKAAKCIDVRFNQPSVKMYKPEPNEPTQEVE